MNLRSTLSIVLLTVLISISLGAYSLAQTFVQPNAQTFTANGKAPRYVISPLDEAFKIRSFGKRPTIKLETQTIDIGRAVACYADLKKVSMQDSLLEALEYLNGVRTTKADPENPKHPRFKSIGTYQYTVTAPADYFKSLDARIESFKLGKQSVVIEVEYIHLDESMQFEARKFLLRDSVKQISGGIPQVTQQMPEKIQDGPYEVVSTLRTSKSLPVTIGQMDRDGYARFKSLVKGRSDCGVISAPTLVSLPGLDALFHNGSVQNFIVGLEQFSSMKRIINEPITQQIERGNFFRVSATPVNSKIHLKCSMAFAEIVGVGTQAVDSDGKGNEAAVQTPIQQVRQIDLNATIAGENALFIDPYHSMTKKITGKGGKKIPLKQNVVAIIRAKVIAAEQSPPSVDRVMTTNSSQTINSERSLNSERSPIQIGR